MHGSHLNEHQDVIRIISSSTNSFDEAVKDGIASLAHHHGDLIFKAFEVVELQGTIQYEGKTPQVQYFQAVLDVAGVHAHHHD